MTKTIKQVLTMIFFTLLGVGLMVWIYRGFDFKPLGHVFSVRGNYVWIVLSLVVGILANLFRSWRWRMLLLGADIPITRRRAVELVFISYLINSVTPRLGEVTRSLLVRRGNVEASLKAFGTVMVEKIADVVCLLFVVLSAMLLRWDDTTSLTEKAYASVSGIASSAFSYVIIAALLVLVVVVFWAKVKHVRTLIGHLWEGFIAIAHLRHPALFVGLCLLIWACNFLQLYLLLPCFENLSNVNAVDAFFLFAAASIGVLLPTPGGAGPWHFAIVKTLTGVFGVDGSTAKLFALVTHGLKTALVMLLGLLAYLTFYWEVLTGAKKRKTR